MKRTAPIKKKMATGGFANWANKNQEGITSGLGYAATAVDAFAPTDNYGVRSNGAALGSGALSGAATGAALGSAVPIVGTAIGAGVGAIVGGVSGLLGNKSANAKKTQAIDASTKAQLSSMEAGAEARIAGDPSLKYGRMSASYYANGGKLTPPRRTPIIPKVQSTPRYMPNVGSSPARQMSKFDDGGVLRIPDPIIAKRDNTTVVPMKLKTTDKDTDAYFKWLKNQPQGEFDRRPHTSEEIAVLDKIRKENGSPTVRMIKGDYPDYHYKPATNEIAYDTVKKHNPFKDDASIFLDEVAHSKQRMDGGMPKIVGRALKDLVKYPGKYIDSYQDNNAIEGEAHNVISPKLWSQYKQEATKDSTANANNSVFKAIRSRTKMANGGKIEPLSTEDVKINGASHANGGVKIPQIGVELEGGETVNDGFVFSKKLGFAKPAEKIARALGKAEARPENPINTATVNALQRKTELLKVQQEQAKKAVGIPSDLPTMAEGGPVMGRDTSVNRSAPTYNPNLLTNGKFMVDKGNGTLGQWGNPLTSDTSTRLPGAVTPVVIPSDKAKGVANTYFPSNNVARNPTPAVIKSPTGRYKFGGTMKKMANGGDEDLPQVNIKAKGKPFAGAYTTDISTAPYKTVDPITGLAALPQMTPAGVRPIDPSVGTPAVTAPVVKPSIGDQIAGGFEKAAPFLSNFYNATQKLPLPPVPELNDEITPNLVDYSASRAEAVRATRGADKAARESLNSGAAVSATKAANLSQQVRSIGQINEAENNTNAGIRGQVASQNAQIKAGNNAMQNNYNNELVARDLKGKQLASANMADIEQKIQGMHRDKKLFDQEDTKLMLTALADDTGASWRGAEPLFKKHLSEESYNQVKDHFGKVSTRQEQDRAEAKTTGKLQAAYLKQQLAKGATKEDGSLKYMLGENAPSITGKPEKSSSKVYDKNGKVIRTTIKD